MVAIESPVSEKTAALLEEWFCDRPESRWSLYRKTGGDRTVLTGYFDSEADAVAAWTEVQTDFPDLSDWPNIMSDLEKDWQTAYRDHFKPWTYRDLLWLPLWMREDYSVKPNQAVVLLDPGMAFGTGDHPTTRLCAYRLVECRDLWRSALERKSVVDAGCGSGILALSAARLGFGNVSGFDSDPDAVRIARENAQANGIARSVAFQSAGLPGGIAPDSADLVLANIQADILIENAKELLRSVRPGGVLCLSGILCSESSDLTDSYNTTAWLEEGRWSFDCCEEGDWCAVSIARIG